MWLCYLLFCFNVDKILMTRHSMNIFWSWINVFIIFIVTHIMYYYFLVGYSVAGLGGSGGVGLCCMCVFLVLIYGGFYLLYLCIMASRCTLYPSVMLPRHGMMFMERCINIGGCVEFDEIVHSNIHVGCLFILCLFILLCCCNVDINKKSSVHK
jgi:hypothetical protein